MKILVIPGNHNLDNLGDNVMLMVAARWLKDLIPGLAMSVVTRNPEQLVDIVPGAEPLVIAGQTRMPGGLVSQARQFPLIRDVVRRRRYRNWTRQVLPALIQVDALVLSGQGVLTDAFSHEAIWRLELLEKAHVLEKKTALFSQGLGVVRNPRLSAAMRQFLPHMDLIVLRNGKDADKLLSKYGCKENQLRIGGDDGLAYPDRLAKPAKSKTIGVSIRLAEYAGLLHPADSNWAGIKRSLKDLTHELGASLLPVPVEPGDLEMVERSFALEPEPEYRGEVDELIRRIARCRLVVTGSYHSAVFALAMGIPAICLVFSDYYAAKFEGLAEQYPGGCVCFDSRTTKLVTFETLLKSMWNQAHSMSARISSISHDIVELNRDHYRFFSNLLLK